MMNQKLLKELVRCYHYTWENEYWHKSKTPWKAVKLKKSLVNFRT